jgi:hypothetical protein
MSENGDNVEQADSFESTDEVQTPTNFEIEGNLKEIITSEDRTGFSFAKLFEGQIAEEGETNEDDKPLSRFDCFRQGVDYRRANEDRTRSKFGSKPSGDKDVNTHSTQYQRKKLELFFQSQNAISLFFFTENDPRFRNDKFLDPERAEKHCSEWAGRSKQLQLVL